MQEPVNYNDDAAKKVLNIFRVLATIICLMIMTGVSLFTAKSMVIIYTFYAFLIFFIIHLIRQMLAMAEARQTKINWSHTSNRIKTMAKLDILALVIITTAITSYLVMNPTTDPQITIAQSELI
jgi:hypothetical protein